MKKTIIYAATRNLYRDMIPAVNSAYLNSNAEVVLLLEDDYNPFITNANVINVSRQNFFRKDGPNALRRWTYMVLMKTALTELFPDRERVLMLDCDTIVREDLTDLWRIDMTDYYYGMVKQKDDGRGGRFKWGSYYNAGVLLCNLEKLRDGKENEIRAALNNVPYDYPEQDAINHLCEGQILELPARYNSCKYNIPDEEEYINHYAADPNWRMKYGKEYDL